MFSLSKQELALVAVTMLWGTTFLIIHTAMQYSGPLFFVGLRFVTAGLIGWVVFRRAMRGITRIELLAGTVIGASIFAGYGLQTYGLQTVSSSMSGFITALYVPIVPLLQWLVWRKAPSLMTLIGVTLAFIGLVLLAGPTTAGFNLSAGEIATLISAFAIAVEVILISYFAVKVNVQRITVVQTGVAGVLSFLCMPIAGESIPEFSWVWLVAAIGLGLSSMVIQYTMNWAQRTVTPTRATLIYASEPVWAGIVGRIAGDRLPAVAILGGALIVLGVLVSEFKLPRRKKRARTEAT
ncbi:DMT family transporter [Alcaligenaceae bacterium 429]|uniref:DMT family transporter n=1 Tax=Paenalcaligenes sp. Me52 TaxID=3392038 RepID=UPI0010932AD9|nr:DMT family transporter [Alcaligenaceae bacterium 429]